MSTALATASGVVAADRPIRVMVVDDAVVARSLLARWVGAEPDMTVVASARNGLEAVERLKRSDPDVVVLDVEMPELDGISALPLLLKQKRDLVVIMASALTRRGAEVTLRALTLGAADYISKPEATPEGADAALFRHDLIEKIRHLGRRRRQATPGRRLATWPRSQQVPLSPHADGRPISLRPLSSTAPRALVIGSSTGGPQALATLVEKLPAAVDRAPVLITQHMPATFTTVLAEALSRICGRGAHEAEHGESVLAGGIYVAPGGRHMRVVRGADGIKIALGDDPPINFCKPAVDPLFVSAAAVWGAATLAVVLTGMGCDGTAGAAAIAAAGGSVIAQDEATSVVWGMPRSVAQAGLCSAVLPLDQIASKVVRLFSGAHA